MTIAPIKCERCEWHLKGARLAESDQLPATEDFIHYVIFKGSSIPLPPSMAGLGERDFDEGPLDLHLAALASGPKAKKKVKPGLSPSAKPNYAKVSGKVKPVGKSLLGARKSKQLIEPSSAQKRVRKLLKACVARASRKAYPTRNVGRGSCLPGDKSLKNGSSKTLSLAVRRLPATSFLKHHRKNLQNRPNRTRKCRKALDYSEDTEEIDSNIRPMTESASAKLLESPDRSLREIRDEITAAAGAKSKFSPSSDEDLPLSAWAGGSSTSRNLLRTPPRSGNSRKTVRKCDLKSLDIIPRRKKKMDNKKVVPVPIELPDLKISVEAVKVAGEGGVGFELKNPGGLEIGGGRRTRSVSWKRCLPKTTAALELGGVHENLQRCRKQLFPPLPTNQKRQRDRLKKLTNHRRAALVSRKPNKLPSTKESCNKNDDEITKNDLGKESEKRWSASVGSPRRNNKTVISDAKYSSKYKPSKRRNAPTKRRSSLKLLTDSSVLKLGDVPTRSSRQPNRYQRLNDRRTADASRLVSNRRSRDSSQSNRNVLLRERSVRPVKSPLRSSSRLVKRPKWLDSADVICEDGEISDLAE